MIFNLFKKREAKNDIEEKDFSFGLTEELVRNISKDKGMCLYLAVGVPQVKASEDTIPSLTKDSNPLSSGSFTFSSIFLLCLRM